MLKLVYSKLTDIENRLPFDINANSIPSSSQLTGVQLQSNLFINGFIGRPSGLTENTGALRIIETDIAVNYCMYWHDPEFSPFFRFTRDQRMILDNYRSDQCVRLGKLGFDRD